MSLKNNHLSNRASCAAAPGLGKVIIEGTLRARSSSLVIVESVGLCDFNVKHTFRLCSTD